MKHKAGRRAVRHDTKVNERLKLISQTVFECATHDIRRAREEKTLSVKDLARQCGLPVAEVEAVTDGRNDATAAAFVAVVWALELFHVKRCLAFGVNLCLIRHSHERTLNPPLRHSR